MVSFGRAREDADVRLLDAIPSANGGSLVTCEFPEGRLCYTVAEPGEHWVINSLAVMAAVRAAGGDMAAAGLALAEMGGLKGRGARHGIAVPGGKALLIDESYNANPASMRATLAQLGQTPSGRRIAVLGSMKELGDFGPQFHAALAEPVLAADVDYAVLVGDEMAAPWRGNWGNRRAPFLASPSPGRIARPPTRRSSCSRTSVSSRAMPCWSRAPTRSVLAGSWIISPAPARRDERPICFIFSPNG